MATKKKDTTNLVEGMASGSGWGKDFPSLNSLLTKDDKKGLFKHSTVSMGFPTGFLPLDYRNGYKTKVFGHDDTVIEEYNNIGIFGGTFNTIIGKTGTAKSTIAAQLSANISKYCYMKFGIPAEIYHLDAERAMNYTRIKTVTNMPIDILKNVYHLTRDVSYIEDIQEMMEKTAILKEQNKETFQVDTGLKDEFGDPMKIFIPTIWIIDSLPSVTIKSNTLKKRKTEDAVATIEDLGGEKDDMQANRIAKAISRFYKQMLPLVNKYNYIVFVINHINKKIETGRIPTSPQTMYLKMDEAVPCGFAPLYYAQNILKIVVDEKFSASKDSSTYPIDGFRANIELLKSRSNKAGQSCRLIYDQDKGFDPLLSLYDYLNYEKKLVDGRNPNKYIKGFENLKFNSNNFDEEVHNNKDLYEALIAVSSTALDEILSNNKFSGSQPSMNDVSLIYNRLNESQQGETFDEETNA